MDINTKRYAVSWIFSHRYDGYKKNTGNYVHLSNAAGIRLQEHIVQKHRNDDTSRVMCSNR